MAGMVAAMTYGRDSVFAPMRHRPFKWFFIAGAISNAGSWMQIVTVPYVIFQITGSRAWLGTAALIAAIPGIGANALSGSIADRFDRRRVLQITQALLLVVAL